MKNLIILMFILFGMGTGMAQPVWELKEQRPGGKFFILDSSLVHHSIDISSLIYIELDKHLIRQKLAGISGQQETLEALLTKVGLLYSITSRGLSAIPEYTRGMEGYAMARSTEEKEAILRTAGENFATLALELVGLSREDPVLRSRLNTRFHELTATGEQGWPEIFSSLLNETEEYAATLERELDLLMEQEGVYVQLAATLYRMEGDLKQSIHLDGFDHFEPPEYYDPYELNLALTDEQSEQMEALKRACDSINRLGIPTLLHRKKEQLATNLKAMVNELDSLLTDLAGQTETILVSDIPTASLRETFRSLKRSTLTLQAEIIHIQQKYSAADFTIGLEVLEMVSADIQRLVSQLALLADDAEKFQQLLNESMARIPQNMTTAMTTLEESLQKIVLKKMDQANKALAVLYTELTGYRTFHDISKLSARFTGEVIRKDLKDLPENALLNVKYHSGYREEGDHIVLEMRGGKLSGEPLTLEKSYFTLLKTQPHFVTNVGIAFVRPEGSSENFKAVVSSNTLFKFGVKGNRTFYRKFIDIGIGINVATLNFDPDNSFEFGAAPVMSVFNDYLIGGYGYNFTQGTGYLLVSVRVPFLSKEFIF
ncbi:MAG: hypothetical protein V2I54_09100 [Bacteroidales bacterium]|jgi:hypothetical protein|nr:hypothetical protein [Bacteroidales bacterium]